MNHDDTLRFVAWPTICSICKAPYTGWGNNAQPINEGRCCDDCNTLVIVARLNLLKRKPTDES